ncbi:hypothetical protein N7457_003394 [Penicillium paradoxum]|uniref:uncharacterized protein n=1 Tax=Penicillium paradoxum TaxID=176176 RepID=UPI002546E073|nr:uncharacterized protein N7457_003394 [Penicillium paradoxum]KAJ5788404.1 hypothetical protein N7457_003394 [Penicillium paradoxum]
MYDGRDGPQCANCHPSMWKKPQVTIYTSPARSQWARPHSNAYLCDNCYWDLNGAADGTPCMRYLRCLCARRKNLAILMTSKRFWNDAAPIFWTENWFAFELPCLLIGFLTALRPQVRSWLRRISFLPLPAYDRLEYFDIFPQRRDPVWNGWDSIARCWSLLQQCEGLVELELDVVALTRVKWARILRQVRVKKRVIFSYQLSEEEQDYAFYEREDPGAWVWGLHSRRKRFDSSTTALIASSMMDKVIRTKDLARHYAQSTLSQRCGVYGAQFVQEIIEGRVQVHENM